MVNYNKLRILGCNDLIADLNKIEWLIDIDKLDISELVLDNYNSVELLMQVLKSLIAENCCDAEIIIKFYITKYLCLTENSTVDLRKVLVLASNMLNNAFHKVSYYDNKYRDITYGCIGDLHFSLSLDAITNKKVVELFRFDTKRYSRDTDVYTKNTKVILNDINSGCIKTEKYLTKLGEYDIDAGYIERYIVDNKIVTKYPIRDEVDGHVLNLEEYNVDNYLRCISCMNKLEKSTKFGVEIGRTDVMRDRGKINELLKFILLEYESSYIERVIYSKYTDKVYELIMILDHLLCVN